MVETRNGACPRPEITIVHVSSSATTAVTRSRLDVVMETHSLGSRSSRDGGAPRQFGDRSRPVFLVEDQPRSPYLSGIRRDPFDGGHRPCRSIGDEIVDYRDIVPVHDRGVHIVSYNDRRKSAQRTDVGGNASNRRTRCQELYIWVQQFGDAIELFLADGFDVGDS